jgi:hypothetical protein
LKDSLRADRGGYLAMNNTDKDIAAKQPEQINGDLRLMELAERNPSLGGRELLREIIERGPLPNENEPPQPRDIRAALKLPSLDDPDYRTQIEQAGWIGNESKIMRDLYERGAEIKGEVLIIPAEEHELSEERDTPFITTLSYVLERIRDVEKATEFHSLARKISGETADTRTQIAVFKTYYDRITLDEHGHRVDEGDRAAALSQTLDEMRRIALEMEKLETRESAEIENKVQGNEERGIVFSESSRRIRLMEEALRFPSNLSYETRERLVSVAIPEIDRRLEGGIDKFRLFAAINRTFLQTDQRSEKEKPDDKPELSEQEKDEQEKIAAFLKSYIDERLRDPETRALNSSSEFRLARARLIDARTPADLGRAAANFLRFNQRNSEALRMHLAAPNRHPQPAARPLNARERNLLFNGRAPDHHTPEMRELRINYGLSRAERAARTEKLHQGLIEPSQSLRLMIDQLDKRRTVKAISHFQASLLNEQMNNEGRLNLYLLHNRIPPHERAYLFESTENRKQALSKPHERNHQEKTLVQSLGRPTGEMPKESQTLREYLASMGQIERQLLNEEFRKLGMNIAPGDDRDGLTITEARAILPEQTARGVRLRARNQAWERIAPAEVFENNPLPEATRISETIAHIQEHLLEKASIAQNARNEFLAEKVREAERQLGDRPESGIGFLLHPTKDGREKFVRSVIVGLSPDDARKLTALDYYAAQTREAVYRGFEEIDLLRRNLELARIQSETQRIGSLDSLQGREFPLRTDEPVFAQADRLSSRVTTKTITSSERQDHELRPGDHQRERSETDTRRGFVVSDREWHFDSLREDLKPQLLMNVDREYTRYPNPNEDHDRAIDR